MTTHCASNCFSSLAPSGRGDGGEGRTRTSTRCDCPSPPTPLPRGARGESQLSVKLVAAFIALSGLLTGCATTGLVSNAAPAKKFVKATPQNPAVKCLCVWQTAEGYDAQGKPCRGVAGQVFFFNRDSDLPVVVDGNVRIFVFDDQGADADQSKPLSQVDIERQTWNTQLTSTQFGPAYRLFVPYVRPGRHQAQLGLRLRMTPDSGPVVFSDLTTIELSGTKPEKLEKGSESPTAAKVEQVLRERLADATRPAFSGDVPFADSQNQAAQRRDSTTIATIRTAARTQN